MIPRLSCTELIAVIRQDGEYAVLDAREEARYAVNHILQASSLPLNRAELGVEQKLPRRDCRIIVCDEDGAEDGPAAQLAWRMRLWAFSNVSVLDGGLEEWTRHGLPCYSGLHTLSKGFGEAVEQRRHTPHISADELVAWRSEGRPHVLIDCRPAAEYGAGTLPHSKNLPGVELPYRVGALLRDAEIPVVVHCAGRTRGIIAGQTLIDVGLPNPVRVLDGGLMGWMLAGQPSAKPEPTHAVPQPDAATQTKMPPGASLDLASFSERQVDFAFVDGWWKDRSVRTTYLIDVRTLEEYTEGHDQRAIHVPGGQLLQSTDVYLPVRNARVIVADDDGARSRIVAHWLRAMGWPEVVSWPMFEDNVMLVRGLPIRSFALSKSSHVQWVDMDDAERMIADLDAQVLDLDSSSDYEKSHIPGSKFIKRSSLAKYLNTNVSQPVILVSSDGVLAWITAADHPGIGNIFVLKGGKEGWRGGGKFTVAGQGTKLDPADDVWRRPIEAPGDLRENMQAYLDWEVGLTAKLLADPSIRFQLGEH